MTHLTFFHPSLRRLFPEPFFPPTAFGGRGSRAARRIPPVDVSESGTDLRIEAELPGVPRENICVRFHAGRLTIEGKWSAGPTDADAGDGQNHERPEPRTRRERREGAFYRSFELPESVDASRIHAEAKDGVLTVVLPKTEKALPREIEVNVS